MAGNAEVALADWQQRIDGLLRTATTGEENAEIARLFELATSNSLALDLWLQFIDFVLQNYSTYIETLAEAPEYAEEPVCSLDEIRALFRKASSALSYHIAESHKIWNRFLEFELLQLSNTSSTQAIDKVRQMLQQRLQVPHLELDATFSSYSSFETQYDNANYELRMAEGNKLYQSTRKLLQAYEPFEMSLRTTDNQPAVYRQYLDYELMKGKKANTILVKMLYERFLQTSLSNADLWEEYIFWQKTTLNRKDNVLPIIRRAILSCSWSGNLQAFHLRALDQFNCSVNEWEEALETAIQATRIDTSSPNELIKVLLEKWAHTLRSFPVNQAMYQPDQVEPLSKIYKTMIAMRDSYYPNTIDPFIQLEQAFINTQLSNSFRNIEEVREVYNTIHTQQSGVSAHWIASAKFEMEHGRNHSTIRALFKKALVATTDYPEVIIDEWLKWERDHANIEAYEMALARSRKLRQQVQHRREKEARAYESQYAEAVLLAYGSEPVNEEVSKSYTNDNTMSTSAVADKKRKASHAVNQFGKHSRRKMPAEDTIDKENEKAEKLNRTLFVRNIDIQPEQTDIVEAIFAPFGKILSVRVLADNEGSSRKCAFVEFERDTSILEAYRFRKTLEHNGQPIWISQAQGATCPNPEAVLELERIKASEQHRKEIGEVIEEKEKRKEMHMKIDVEGRTLYVANLGPTVTTDLLRTRFAQIGDVEDVRLMETRFGQSKGYAYITMISPEAAQQCLKLDGIEVAQRAITVAMSDPTRGKNMKHHTVKGTRVRDFDPRVVHITNLPYSTTNDHLRVIFEQAGSLRDVRVAIRNGRSRGFAFIDFENESDAVRAAEQFNGHEIDGRQLSVKVAQATGKSEERTQEFKQDERRQLKMQSDAVMHEMINERRAKLKQQQEPKKTVCDTPFVPRQTQLRTHQKRKMGELSSVSTLARDKQQQSNTDANEVNGLDKSSKMEANTTACESKDNGFFRNLFLSTPSKAK